MGFSQFSVCFSGVFKGSHGEEKSLVFSRFSFPKDPDKIWHADPKIWHQFVDILLYKCEAYCSTSGRYIYVGGVSLPSRLRSQEGAAIQMGGILPYIQDQLGLGFVKLY